jgi:hypothetical protein
MEGHLTALGLLLSHPRSLTTLLAQWRTSPGLRPGLLRTAFNNHRILAHKSLIEILPTTRLSWRQRRTALQVIHLYPCQTSHPILVICTSCQTWTLSRRSPATQSRAPLPRISMNPHVRLSTEADSVTNLPIALQIHRYCPLAMLPLLPWTLTRT